MIADPSAPWFEAGARAGLAVLMAGIASENDADASLVGSPKPWDREDDPRHRADMKLIQPYLEGFRPAERDRELERGYTQAVRLIANSLPVRIALVNALEAEGRKGRGVIEDTIRALTGALQPIA